MEGGSGESPDGAPLLDNGRIDKKEIAGERAPADSAAHPSDRKATNRRRRLVKCWLVCGVVPMVFYFAAPLIAYCFPSILTHIFFLNFLKVPNRDFFNLSSHGVVSQGRNFYLQMTEEIRLGCWHILPRSLSARGVLSNAEMEKSLSTAEFPVVVYLHGNAFDRAIYHRCQLYNILSEMGFHVLSVDYRGYGDSTGSPSAGGLVNDSKEIISYVRNISASNQVFVWGHSLGTGIGVAAVKDFSDDDISLAGLILEAPFNNVRDVITYNPLSAPFRWLPWFDDFLVKPLINAGIHLTSDIYITRVSCPVLIMHAEDDGVIPCKLGRLLRDAAQSAHRDVVYVEFEADRKLRHKYIYTVKELPAIVTSFAAKCMNKSV